MANFNPSHAQMLAFMAPEMIAHGPKGTFMQGLFIPGETAVGGKVAETLSDLAKVGSWNRSIWSEEEYLERYREETWEFPTGKFKIKIGVNTEIQDVEAVFVLDAFPGRQGDGQWLFNERDAKPADQWTTPPSAPFKKDGGSQGEKPAHTVYLSVPVCVLEDEPKTIRFRDNTIYSSAYIATLLNSLGLKYSDNMTGGVKPFAVLRLKLTHLGNITNYGVTEQCTPTQFAMRVKRRPDFLADRDICRGILQEAVLAAAPNVPPEMKKWFLEHFPQQMQDRVPISVRKATKANTSDDYRIYNLDKDGEKFNREFRAGQDHVLAIYHVSGKRFLDSVAVDSMTKGVAITPFNPANPLEEAFLKAKPKAKKGYNSLKKHALKMKEITSENSNIPLLLVSVNELQKFTDGSWQPSTIEEFNHTSHDFRPTRGVHVIAASRRIQLGKVVDVPAYEKKANAHRGGGEKKGNGASSVPTTGNVYCDDPGRDPSIPVEFDEKNRVLRLNLNYPAFRRYNMPDEIGSPTQKLLEEIYFDLQRLADAIYEGLKFPLKVDSETAAESKLNNQGEPIYRDNCSDWTINHTIDYYLASSEEIQDKFHKVDMLRQNVAA